jgi:hypothetical protein
MTQPADIARADQADAAHEHLARILERTAPALLGTDTTDTEPEPWLAARMDAFADRIEAGAVQLCTHLEHATAPMPAFGILGIPRLACTACVTQLGPTEHADYRCDRCNQPTTVMEPAIATLDTIALVIVLCDLCADDRAQR